MNNGSGCATVWVRLLVGEANSRGYVWHRADRYGDCSDWPTDCRRDNVRAGERAWSGNTLNDVSTSAACANILCQRRVRNDALLTYVDLLAETNWNLDGRLGCEGLFRGRVLLRQ